MNPSILHFSRTGSAIKALFFLGFAAIAFTMAALLHAEGEVQPEAVHLPGGVELPAPAPRRDPLAPFKIPAMIVAGGVCLFYVGRHGLRAIARGVAVKIENRHLHLHPSYGAVSNPLPLGDIDEVIYDRADRLPGEGRGSARLGARLRHGLHIGYRAGGATRQLRLVDNDVDGGAEQLRRFAAHLDSWRQSAARTAAGHGR